MQDVTATAANNLLHDHIDEFFAGLLTYGVVLRRTCLHWSNSIVGVHVILTGLCKPLSKPISLVKHVQGLPSYPTFPPCLRLERPQVITIVTERNLLYKILQMLIHLHMFSDLIPCIVPSIC